MGFRCTTSRCSEIGRLDRFLPKAAARLDYRKVSCPNSDLICREQCVWLEQCLFLGPRTDMDDISRAFEKIYENQGLLRDWFRRNHAA